MNLSRTNAIVPLTAASNLTGKVGRFVTRSGDSVALATAPAVRPFGVLLTDGKAGEQVTVAIGSGGLAGTVRVKLGANVTVSGSFLQLGADGCAIPENPADPSRCLCALALEAGQTGELIEAALFLPVAHSETIATMGVVIHGADAGLLRPIGYAVVTWIGSVEPVNAAVNDIWEDTTA